MPILRKEKHSNFTTVNNYFINDVNLKPDSKVFLLFMLSKPDNWDFNFSNFEKSLGIGEKAIRSLIKKLEELGYLRRERVRGDNGHYEWVYFVYEEPFDRLKNKSPCSPSGHMEQGDVVEGNIYQYTELSNTELTKDKYDKLSGDTFDKNEHSVLTLELINLGYISEDDISSFSYDELFKYYLGKGYNIKQLYSSIHYIAPKVIARNFMDEEGNQIDNKYKYFRASLQANFKRLENRYTELYADEIDGEER